MKRFGVGVVLIGLGVCGGCSRQAAEVASNRPWPADDYQRPVLAVADSPCAQVVFGITASDEAPYEKLAKKAALVGVELLSVEDSRGGIHLQVTVVHPRRPFILRVEDGNKKSMFEMGREGAVYAFASRSVSMRSWDAARIPKDVAVKSVRLVLEPDLDHPLTFKRGSSKRQIVRWPTKGSVSKFPLYFALAFRLDNGQTLLRPGGINMRGHPTAARYFRVKTRDVDNEKVREMCRATAEHRDPKGVAILR
ncbi:MAG: hypothetical protein KAI47_19240 [Deltaproteobacteria bacterium]|nr:hypothetical protein [Deltaproteobacteria bacterium]